MAILALFSAKTAPGVTTSAAALALMWPIPVLLVDADPTGGDLLASFISSSGDAASKLHSDIGLASFATATRHRPSINPDAFKQHIQALPHIGHVSFMAGLSGPKQALSIDEPRWQHLADALKAAHDQQENGRFDVLIDCGRFNAYTLWPLIYKADLALLVVRPTLRSVAATRAGLAAYNATLSQLMLGALVCGPGRYSAQQVTEALGLPLRAQLPDDHPTASAITEGDYWRRGFSHSPLMRAARVAAENFHCSGRTVNPATNGIGIPPNANRRIS